MASPSPPNLLSDPRPVVVPALIAAGPALALAGWRSGVPHAAWWSLAAALLLSLGGLAALWSARLGAVLTLATGISSALLCLPALASSPALVLTVVSAGTLTFGALWSAPRMPLRLGAMLSRPSSQRIAAGVSMILWAAVALAIADPQRIHRLAVLASFCTCALLLAGWSAVAEDAPKVRRIGLLLLLLLGGGGAALLVHRPGNALSLVALTIGAAALLVRSPLDRRAEGIAWFVEHPARLIVATFMGLCVLGTVLLALPASSAGAIHISTVDAAFTAVSAVCVTGLVVLDTPTVFGSVGQVFILLLIQAGGLGIMTFYTATLRVFGRRLSLKHELAVAGAVTGDDRGRLFRALGQVLVVTAVAEGIGALILAVRFATLGDTPGVAAWRGLFTAVSAFCNAGFALQTDSLIPYQADPIALHTVALLIVTGGLSPPIVWAIPALARRKPVPVQVKIVLFATALLLGFGFLGFLSFEWQNTLAEMPLGTRLNNAWFQSASLRTAGFNSVDLAATTPATQVLMIALMFVGAGPGGTAGGIKITTAAILILAVLAAMRGKKEAQAFGRKIGQASVYKAAAVATMGLISALAALVAVLLTQRIPPEMAAFEVVSALATVGLSTGGTVRLDEVGKALIMACMFMGRVGPLTLFLFLQEQRADSVWTLPEEEVDVG